MKTWLGQNNGSIWGGEEQRVDGWLVDGRADGWIDGTVGRNGWMDVGMDGHVNGWFRWMDGWMDGRMNAWLSGWTET